MQELVDSPVLLVLARHHEHDPGEEQNDADPEEGAHDPARNDPLLRGGRLRIGTGASHTRHSARGRNVAEEFVGVASVRVVAVVLQVLGSRSRALRGSRVGRRHNVVVMTSIHARE